MKIELFKEDFDTLSRLGVLWWETTLKDNERVGKWLDDPQPDKYPESELPPTYFSADLFMEVIESKIVDEWRENERTTLTRTKYYWSEDFVKSADKRIIDWAEKNGLKIPEILK